MTPPSHSNRTSQPYHERAARSLSRIAEARPLIHHITNPVVANDVANLTLAFGALPVMADAPEEVAEITEVAQALVLNLGVLSAAKFEAMLRAGRVAAARSIPIVLDPVGAGATAFRTASALRLLAALPITTLRGNRGEIGALLGAGAMRGVEAVGTEDPHAIATAAAARFGVVVAVTGVVDVVVGNKQDYAVHNGDPLLPRVTGTGCMASAAVGILLAAGDNAAMQTALALGLYGLAAERAATPTDGGKRPGPGTFRARLLDAVAALSASGVAGIRITKKEEEQ
ncbi:MAG: hydroxyethylthiazole kinase [Chloroflexota bacterium]|nr:hydroxyethylthiazole kinase [Chloroflexota bacterium]